MDGLAQRAEEPLGAFEREHDCEALAAPAEAERALDHRRRPRSLRLLLRCRASRRTPRLQLSICCFCCTH